MKMEIKGSPSHPITMDFPSRTSQQAHWLPDADKVWDVLHNWNTQLQSITAVNVCSNPRVKANKLLNKKLCPGPNTLSLYTNRPEPHCEGQCFAVVLQKQAVPT